MPDSVPIAGDFNGDGRTEIGVFVDGDWFIDINGNGVWDSDRGTDTMGGARDAVLYTVTVSYPRAFPLMHLLGFSQTVTSQSQTVLRNQPYGTQNRAAGVGQCA